MRHARALRGRDGPYSFSETELARQAFPHLTPEMLCIADRGFFGYELWQEAAATGGDLLWRVRSDAVLPRHEDCEDGSYVSKIYPSPKDRERDRKGLNVRVIEYVLVDEMGNVTTPENDDRYRLITTILDPEMAPAGDLAALYHERWEIENAFDEFKTHLRGRGVVLRSKTPDLVRQEFYGLLLAHYAVRGLIHEAALKADIDPDKISFVHSVRVIRRKAQSVQRVPGTATFPPSGNRDAS